MQKVKEKKTTREFQTYEAQCLTSNFPLQYQYIVNQASDENTLNNELKLDASIHFPCLVLLSNTFNTYYSKKEEIL